MPDISVIVPVYNVEQYLRCCLDSLCAQTLQDIEFICVNDGSTDSSLKILKEYQKKDSRFIIIDQPNKGPSAARNLGFDKAKGKYIGYIDSDDWVPADFFEKLFVAAEYHKADIAGGNIEYMLPEGHKNLLKLKKYKAYTKTADKYKVFDIPRLNFIWNKIYRRDLLKQLGLRFPEGVIFEDILFTHQILDQSDKVVTVPEAVYFYRQNPCSCVQTMTDEKQKQLHQAIKSAQEYVVRQNIKVDICKYPKLEKRYIRFCGIKVCKVLVWDCIRKYYVCGVKVFQDTNIKA